MRIPLWQRGHQADGPRAGSSRGRRSTPARVESLEGRDLLATVLPSPGGLAPVEVAPRTLPVRAVAPAVAYAQFEPSTGRVVVQFTADPAGYDPAVLTNPANYGFSLIEGFENPPAKGPARAGVAVSRAEPITGVTLAGPIGPGSGPTVVVSVAHDAPLGFGIYGFAVRSGGIADLAGTPLSGSYGGTFPSGGSQPGGNFLAVLAEPTNSVLPASGHAASASPSGGATGYGFLPSTRAFRVRYLSATPGPFKLAGGNKATPHTISYQYLPGTYRLPSLRPSTIPGASSTGRSG